MLQTCSMMPSLIYKVSFSLRKIIQISVCLTSHLNRIYIDHTQKRRCLYNHSPTNMKWVTAKIILVSPALIFVGEWLQRQRHFWAWSLYVLSKLDVRHRLHCLLLTDTYLYNFTKGKTYRVNQRWCHTTCLQHPCYEVGCLLPLLHAALRTSEVKNTQIWPLRKIMEE